VLHAGELNKKDTISTVKEVLVTRKGQSGSHSAPQSAVWDLYYKQSPAHLKSAVMVEGENSSMMCLIYCKNLCKWHNVSLPSTTIKKTKEICCEMWSFSGCMVEKCILVKVRTCLERLHISPVHSHAHEFVNKFVPLTLWATWDSSSESTPQILTELHVTLASFFLLALSNYNTTLESSIHLAESRSWLIVDLCVFKA
jgi:hypothetical protein